MTKKENKKVFVRKNKEDIEEKNSTLMCRQSIWISVYTEQETIEKIYKRQ